MANISLPNMLVTGSKSLLFACSDLFDEATIIIITTTTVIA